MVISKFWGEWGSVNQELALYFRERKNIFYNGTTILNQLIGTYNGLERIGRVGIVGGW